MKHDTKDLDAIRKAQDVSVMEIAQATRMNWQTVYKALKGKAGKNSNTRVREFVMNLQLKSKTG